MKLEFYGHPTYVGEEITFTFFLEGVQFYFDGKVLDFLPGEQIAIPSYVEGELQFSEEKGRYVTSRHIDFYEIYEFKHALVSVPKWVAENGVLNIPIGYKSLANVETCNSAIIVADNSRLKSAVSKVVELPEISLELSKEITSVKRKDSMTARTPEGVLVYLPTYRYYDDVCCIVGTKEAVYRGSNEYTQTVWTATPKR